MTTESINAARDPEREMLELAAKAAGIVGKYTEFANDEAAFVGAYAEPTAHGTTGFFWNPRTDDGDALRLAVKLGLTVYVNYCENVSAAYPNGQHNMRQVVGHAGYLDAYAATRLAIVRAAAAIGKALP